MSEHVKNQENILQKLGVEQLNTMQLEAKNAIHSNAEVVLLSPTGTGKTLAFLLPIIAELDRNCEGVQAMVLVPSRELAIQIEQVIREMGSGFKANAFYGGRSFSKDRIDLNHAPAILVGTPGRIADHLRRDTFSVDDVKVLVLDEFDKSLEVGFESDMMDIMDALPALKKKVLTSATQKVSIPKFVGLKDPIKLNFVDDGGAELQVKTILSPAKNKLDTLVDLLQRIGDEPGIIFCNFKETIQFVSDHLSEKNIDHGCFFGGMEQNDRERVLIKFRNGTHRLMVATDLAARGLDVPEIKFIIHFQLPLKDHEFTHRNGRTARMKSDGTAYVLKWEEETLPDFAEKLNVDALWCSEIGKPLNSIAPAWKTLFISGGRKDKISKGDIAGLFFKLGNLTKDELGVIELKNDCAFVGVKTKNIEQLINVVDNYRLKKKKVRITLLQ